MRESHSHRECSDNNTLSLSILILNHQTVDTVNLEIIQLFLKAYIIYVRLTQGVTNHTLVHQLALCSKLAFNVFLSSLYVVVLYTLSKLNAHPNRASKRSPSLYVLLMQKQNLIVGLVHKMHAHTGQLEMHVSKRSPHAKANTCIHRTTSSLATHRPLYRVSKNILYRVSEKY